MTRANRSLRIHHIVARIDDMASGPSHSIPALCRGLQQRDHEVSLHVLEPLPKKKPDISIVSYKANPLGGPLDVSGPMKQGLRAIARQADVVHYHGLWKMPNVYPASAVRGSGSLLVASPRGMLAPEALNYSRMKKRLFWAALQGRAVRDSGLLHATSDKEAEEMRIAGLTAPIAVIPNGVSIPADRHTDKASPRRLLYLGRLHPIKGVEDLLTSWARLQDRFEDWELVVAGPGDTDYVNGLIAQSEQLGARRIRFVGPVYGEEKSELLWSSELFVLPSKSESASVAVAEALAHSVPVIVTKGTPWQSVEEHGAGWWVDPDASSIHDALASAMSQTHPHLREMGVAGRRLMETDYSWEHLSEMLEAAYRWALEGGERPPWISVS